MKRILLVIAILIVSLLTGKVLPSNESRPPQPELGDGGQATASSELSPAQSATARVVRVIDGDTIELEGGNKVRYIGIDAPESVDPKRPDMCFGHEASAENKALVEGKDVRLVRDVSETDKYGRLLRYVYVSDIFVNDYLVRQGFAHASTFPPDVKYAKKFVAAEDEARIYNRGLWSGCSLR